MCQFQTASCTLIYFLKHVLKHHVFLLRNYQKRNRTNSFLQTLHVGLGKATTLNSLGFKCSVTLRIAPPFPAASQSYRTFKPKGI